MIPLTTDELSRRLSRGSFCINEAMIADMYKASTTNVPNGSELPKWLDQDTAESLCFGQGFHIIYYSGRTIQAMDETKAFEHQSMSRYETFDFSTIQQTVKDFRQSTLYRGSSTVRLEQSGMYLMTTLPVPTTCRQRTIDQIKPLFGFASMTIPMALSSELINLEGNYMEIVGRLETEHRQSEYKRLREELFRHPLCEALLPTAAQMTENIIAQERINRRFNAEFIITTSTVIETDHGPSPIGVNYGREGIRFFATELVEKSVQGACLCIRL